MYNNVNGQSDYNLNYLNWIESHLLLRDSKELQRHSKTPAKPHRPYFEIRYIVKPCLDASPCDQP